MNSNFSAPKTITLSTGEVAELKRITTQMQGLQQMMTQFQDQYQMRAAALNSEQQQFWQGVAAKYGLDLDKVLYGPNSDGTQLVPQQIVLR